MENTEQPAKSGSKTGSCFLFGCGGCSLFLFSAALFLIALVLACAWISDFDSEKTFEVETVSGYPEDGEKKVAVIPVHGVIQYGGGHTGVVDPEQFSQMMDEAESDPSIAAVIISIDSPGGEVNAADEIYRRILAYRKKTKNPVVAVMRTIAASGGYYVAAACDKIVAGEMTMTGSIGVIISTYNYSGLLKMIGVSGEVYKSGAMKDMLNPARSRTKEEAAIVQELVGECYQVFAGIVAKNRKLPLEKVMQAPIGDGRVYHGKKAVQYGLVDKLGYLSDGVALCEELCNAKSGTFSVIRYKQNYDFLNFLLSGESPVFRGISLNIPMKEADGALLKPGRLYYLPGGMK